MNTIAVLRRALPWASAIVLAACGGGGGDAPANADPDTGGPSNPSAPAASVRWLANASNNELHGTSYGGVDGPLAVVNPAAPSDLRLFAATPVDSTVVRIGGGKVDATLSGLTEAGTRHLVWDVAGSGGQVTLHKMALDQTAGSAPVAQRLSNETRICNTRGVRFEVVGQSLSGDEAFIAYDTPGAGGSCAAGVALPRLVRLTMSAADAPIELDATAALRVTPIAPIHGSSGQVAAFLGWQNGRFVRTDATLRNATPLPDASVGGVVTPASAPLAPGFATRYGIFVRSADGLRRYDKSTDRLSAPLVTGQVAAGTAVDQVADDRAYYVTRVDGAGRIDLFRVEDLLAPTVEQLNTDGPLRPVGFRVLKSHVLYAVEGRSDWTAWRKADGQRVSTFAGRNVALASTVHERVFTLFLDGAGIARLAQSQPDGSDERVFMGATLLGASLADTVSPYARALRLNAAFSHALVAVAPAAGGAAEVRWIGFEGAATDVSAGSIPASPATEADWQSAGIAGADTLVGVRKAGGTERYLFVARRQPASLARAADGVQ